MKTKPKYPVGTVWVGVDKEENVGYIVLVKSDYYLGKWWVIFQAHFSWADGSGGKLEYFGTYQAARYWLGTFIESSIRFKRIEE